MMTQKIISLALFSVLTCCALHGTCQKIDKSAVTESFIPKDLKDSGNVLLVKVRDYESYKIKKYQKLFSKEYTGEFHIVPFNVLIDQTYPDVKRYKYVLVIAGGIRPEDFSGISDRDNFFDKNDGSFMYTGSSLYIFDRSSNHPFYEASAKNIMQGTSFEHKGKIYAYEEDNSDLVSFPLLKKYIQLLNGGVK